LLVLVGVVVLTAGPALAQCSALINEIDKETATRYDPAAAQAKEKAMQATKLDKDGKHAECEKVAKEALAALGIKK
jgi:hypothetical protein